MKRLIYIVVFLFLPALSWAACVGPTQSTVQTAVGNASIGDTVTVCDGDATWTATSQGCAGNTYLCSSKAIEIVGGTGTITLSGTVTYGGIKFELAAASVTADVPFGVSGFTFDGGGSTLTGEGVVSVKLDSYATEVTKLRIHDNTFNDFGGSAVIMVNGPAFGVVDNNTFTDCGGYTLRSMGGNLSGWALTTKNGRVAKDRLPGHEDNLFFEDNLFNYTTSGQEYLTMWGQGAVGIVFRYNTYDLTNNTRYSTSVHDQHGLQTGSAMAWTAECSPGGSAYCGSSCTSCTGGYTCADSCDDTIDADAEWSTVKSEFYGNYYGTDAAKAYTGKWLELRGSQTFFFNNKSINQSGYPGNLSFSEFACDSTQTPALQDGGSDYSQHIQNTYTFNNQVNGVEKALTKSSDYCGDYAKTNPSPQVITEDSEYFNYNASCSGSGTCASGVGIGATAPTGDCTTGTGFWVWSQGTTLPATLADMKTYTQAGVFYKCTETDTWTEYYTPYTYPHPLRDEAVAIPSNAIQGVTIN